MANKYLYLNKVSVGFIILICVLFIYKYSEIVSQDMFPILFENDEDYVDVNFDSIIKKIKRISEIKEIINQHNDHPIIMNSVEQNAINKEYLAVIVVVVRSNALFFQSLVESLKLVKGIRKALLIFSHEIYDDHMNEIARNITFTKYIQIYYPYSAQLHHKAFPGDDPNFCSEDLKCQKNNGRRNVSVVQKKQHWWWTVNFVFDDLKPMHYHNRTVVFIEEHQCVTTDLIYILNMLEYVQPNACPHCIMFSLAILKANITTYYRKPGVVTIREIGSTQELMGIGFNRTGWNEIKKLRDNFCSFDDVDWTRSLIYSVNKAPVKSYYMLSIDGPRVLSFDTNISMCCSDSEKVELMKMFLLKIKNGLFPRRLIVRPHEGQVMLNITKGRGGWDDARDHILCKYFTIRNRRL